MDPMLTNDERNMQEELLRHEFPFDEKAWISMEALLEDEKQKPPAGLPPNTGGPRPGPGRAWGLLLLLLFSVISGSAAFIWWINSGETATLTSDSGIRSTEKGTAFFTPVESANETVPVLPISTATDHQEQQNVNTKIPSSTEKDRANLPARGSKTMSPESAYIRQRGQSRNIERTSAAVANQGASGTITEHIQVANSQGVDPAPLLVMPTASMDTMASQEIKPPGLNVLALPFPAPEMAHNFPDSLIRPVKAPRIQENRLERGWIFGVNANTVDYKPLRLSTLPHLGYFVSYRFLPGTAFQAELVAKLVSGYGLHAEFVDIVPGGSDHLILNSNNLLFLELPLVVKHTFKPGQSWLLGIKPALDLTITPGGLTSYSNNGVDRFYDSQEGIRYFDLGIVLGWEWRFNKRWALDLRYNQGLFDLTFDQFYRDNSTHLNSDFQVSIRHIIGKKIRFHAPKTLFPVPAGQ